MAAAETPNNFGQIIQEAQKMQEAMKVAQEELANFRVIGESGGGLVKITMNGKHEVLEVKISDSVMDDKEMLEDLIAAAINDAAKKIEEESKRKITALASQLKLPEDFKLPTDDTDGDDK